MLTPGPTAFIVMKNAIARNGYVRYATAFGVSAASLINVCLVIGGVVSLAVHDMALSTALRRICAFYLIYLAIKTFRNQRWGLSSDGSSIFSAVSIGGNTASGKNEFMGKFLEGFLANLLNPAIAVFYLSLFSQIILPETSNNTRILFGVQIIVQSLAFWLVFSSLAATNRAKIFILSHERKLHIIFGFVMLWFGLGFLYEDVTGLFVLIRS